MKYLAIPQIYMLRNSGNMDSGIWHHIAL